MKVPTLLVSWTEVPVALITSEIAMSPRIPWLIVPVQVPANRAGPGGPRGEGVGVDLVAGSEALTLGLDCVFRGAARTVGAGVGLSVDSFMGAGSRCAVTSNTTAPRSIETRRFTFAFQTFRFRCRGNAY